MKTFIISVLLLSSLFANGQNTPEPEGKKMLSPKELKEDYLILRKALETTYPSLYRFTDSLSISRYLDSQINLLNRPMSEIEFYRLIALTCARTNDEHVISTPSKAYYLALEKSNHFFPFSLKIIDRRLYLLKSNLRDDKMPVGSEILSINGHSTEEILNALLPTISSDGYIQTFNIRHLEDYCMTQNENLFDLNYPIFVEEKDSFRIEFVHPELKSEKQALTIAGIDFHEYKKFYNDRREYKAPLEFKYLKSDIAYLRIHSFHKFHRDDFGQNFNSLYDSIFYELKQSGTKNLILDLRNNEGGDGTGEKLIPYLLRKPYTHLSFIEEKFSGYPPVVDYLENGENLFFIDSIVYRTSTGMYRLRKEYHSYVPLLDEKIPDKNNYTENLYILINGASGSMANVVASFIKGNTDAIFIGEESGGTVEGHTGESYAFLVLPNSKIRVMIPLTKKAHNLDFVQGRGVYPDYSVGPKITDILKGIDTELDFTLDLISKKAR